MSEIAGGITVLFIFIGLCTPLIIIALVYYITKRFEHKQILAAIEKGTPLSELRPPKPTGLLWIKNITTGIAFLIMAAGFVQIRIPLVRGLIEGLKENRFRLIQIYVHGTPLPIHH